MKLPALQKISLCLPLALFALFAPLAVAPPAGNAAAGEFLLPERPTAPTPPQRPQSRREPEKKSPPAGPSKTAVPQRAAEKPSAAPEKPPIQKTPQTKAHADEAAEKSEKKIPPAAAATPSGAIPPDGPSDEPAAAAALPKAAPPENPLFQSFVHYTLYSILLLAILAFSGYLYFTTPTNAKPKAPPKASAKRGAQPPQAAPQRSAKAAAAAYNATLPFGDAKIANKSLLEQLVKYDLETYGEIRSNLDYEQPAYVEKLIRKYGGDDTAKINHAIHRFYQNRR